MFYKTSRIASSPGFRVLSPGLSFPGLVLHYVELTKLEIRSLTIICHKTALECLTAFTVSSDTTRPVCVHNGHCDTVLAVTDRLIGSPQLGDVCSFAALHTYTSLRAHTAVTLASLSVFGMSLSMSPSTST